MTPAQLEHLKLIDAHLANLLSTAEKRTPGEWKAGPLYRVEDGSPTGEIAVKPGIARMVKSSLFAEEDAAFIASCAGNAEAGWRATRSAIALLFAMCDGAHSINTVIAAQKMGESILAAFPLELLK